MSIQAKVFRRMTLATAVGISLAPFTLATSLRAQTTRANPLYEIADASVAELLADHDCAILTKQGFIATPDDVDADTDNDGRVERFCSPGFVQRIKLNEYFSQTDLLTQTDLDKDGIFESNETHVIEINGIRSVRQITPGNYYMVISGTGTVNEANVIDLVEISEDEAKALLNEIERVRHRGSNFTALSTPAPTPPPARTPVPTPAPRVQSPAPRVQPPSQPVPGLW